VISPTGWRPSSARSSRPEGRGVASLGRWGEGRCPPLARYTTLGVGGRPEVFAAPRDLTGLRELLGRLADAGLPWRVLGRGSNVVPCDGRVPGAVVHTAALRSLVVEDHGGDEVAVRAGAGVPTSVLLSTALRRGLGGLESLVGYPATVGGAARMNAGGRWGEAGDRVESVQVVEEGGRVRTLDRAACAFGYRTSALGRAVVAEVTFRLPRADPVELRRRVEEIQREKAAAQPLGQPSAGCTFRNPPGISAGRLLDELGLKGRRVGGAEVSSRHGNFIVNRGGATAQDVLRLAESLREEVERLAGVVLELEVEAWEPDQEPPAAAVTRVAQSSTCVRPSGAASGDEGCAGDE